MPLDLPEIQKIIRNHWDELSQNFGVDLGIMWAVIQDELPPLQDEIKKLTNQLT